MHVYNKHRGRWEPVKRVLPPGVVKIMQLAAFRTGYRFDELCAVGKIKSCNSKSVGNNE